MVFKKLIVQNTYVELETPTPPFMEKSILNFHFDYWIISLSATSISDGTFCYIYIKDYQNTAHGIPSNSLLYFFKD